MADLRVVVITCDRYGWCLYPFAYLFNTYWSAQQPVIVGGVPGSRYNLPPNFSFACQHRSCSYPQDRWSDSLIDTLQAIPDELVVVMLEDYFIQRTADCAGISTLADYMQQNGDVVRMDLTTDRLYGGGMRDVRSWGHYDLVACPKNAPYEMSLQAAIWNRRNLLTLLKPGKTSWETEIHTDMSNSPYRVLGTRQYPLRYANAIFKGKIVDGELAKIDIEHKLVIEQWIPKTGWEHVENYG